MARQSGAENSFELIALEWHAKNIDSWTPSHGDRILTRFKQDVFPWLGKCPIADIKAPELLKVLERIQTRGAIERQLAHAERNTVRASYNYAEHLPERRKMMQAWADYLEAL